MKKYFTKYLPVEGEIKAGDIYLSSTNGFINEKTDKPLNIPYWVTKVTKVKELGFDIEHLNGKSAGYIPFVENPKPVKLFLCSRDIQVGDEAIHLGSFEKAIVEEIIEDCYKLSCDVKGHYSSKNQWCKVIGEVSSKATWVKEGDEFDDSEVMWVICDEYGDPEDYCELHELETPTEFDRIIIKGPCGHFH